MEQWRSALLMLLLVPVTAFAVVWAGYGFSVGTGRITAALPQMTLPAPSFFAGVRAVVDLEGFVSYAFGRTTLRGWWWYFPAAVGLKTTLPFLLLWAAGAYFACRTPRLRLVFIESTFGAFAILAVAMPSSLDLGVRYVLPLYVPLTLAATAAAVALFEASGPILRGGAILLIALHVVVSAIAHPDYFPFFNLLAGKEPGRCLIDSNLDWGQDVLRLSIVARRLNIPRLGVSIPGNRRSDAEFKAAGLPPTYAIEPFWPRHGWIAVGEHYYRIYREEKGWRWLDRYPMRRIGTSIRLYYVPPSDVGPDDPTIADEIEQVLLPIAGTAGGARWQVDQTVLNKGREPVHLTRSNCDEGAACVFDLGPFESLRLTGSDPIRPFIYVSAQRATLSRLTFTTIVRRVDQNGPGAETVIPSVRKSEFRSGTIEIAGVPFSARQRLNLRLYADYGNASAAATVRIRDEKGVIAERAIPIYSTGFYTHGDFRTLFPELRDTGKRVDITIDTIPRAWAFITATDADGRSTLYLPKSVEKKP